MYEYYTIFLGFLFTIWNNGLHQLITLSIFNLRKWVSELLLSHNNKVIDIYSGGLIHPSLFESRVSDCWLTWAEPRATFDEGLLRLVFLVLVVVPSKQTVFPTAKALVFPIAKCLGLVFPNESATRPSRIGCSFPQFRGHPRPPKSARPHTERKRGRCDSDCSSRCKRTITKWDHERN